MSLRPGLVIHVVGERGPWWRHSLQSQLPELDCRLWDDPGDPAAIRYAVVWRPPAGGLKKFRNLQAIFSIGAGVDHILCDPELPAVPVFRLTGAELTQRMREYIALQVLRCHRRQAELDAQQRAGEWRLLPVPLAGERPVGVMGLGTMGRAAAETLAGLGFRVAGWSRTPHALDAIEVFHGEAGRDAFLARSEILVCLLPLTAGTRGILDRTLFERLPSGTWVINAARGEHLVEADLLAALDSGWLAGAVLDVFAQEPLPPEHPFWGHPRITVTPHVASRIDSELGSRLLAATVRRFRAGDPLPEQRVDPARGY